MMDAGAAGIAAPAQAAKPKRRTNPDPRCRTRSLAQKPAPPPAQSAGRSWDTTRPFSFNALDLPSRCVFPREPFASPLRSAHHRAGRPVHHCRGMHGLPLPLPGPDAAPTRLGERERRDQGWNPGICRMMRDADLRTNGPKCGRQKDRPTPPGTACGASGASPSAGEAG